MYRYCIKDASSKRPPKVFAVYVFDEVFVETPLVGPKPQVSGPWFSAGRMAADVGWDLMTQMSARGEAAEQAARDGGWRGLVAALPDSAVFLHAALSSVRIEKKLGFARRLVLERGAEPACSYTYSGRAHPTPEVAAVLAGLLGDRFTNTMR